jgi:hypothetical protein
MIRRSALVRVPAHCGREEVNSACSQLEGSREAVHNSSAPVHLSSGVINAQWPGARTIGPLLTPGWLRSSIMRLISVSA